MSYPLRWHFNVPRIEWWSIILVQKGTFSIDLRLCKTNGKFFTASLDDDFVFKEVRTHFLICKYSAEIKMDCEWSIVLHYWFEQSETQIRQFCLLIAMNNKIFHFSNGICLNCQDYVPDFHGKLRKNYWFFLSVWKSLSGPWLILRTFSSLHKKFIAIA